MGISNRLRPALGRITSSVASTASYGITHVLSFTDSFNEHTSLLLDAALAHEEEQQPDASPSAWQGQDTPAPTTPIVATFDIEAAPTPPVTRSIRVHGGSGGQEPPASAAQDAESKRVAKAVHTICLFGASASLLLFVNTPRGGSGGAMYRANLFFVCLGLFASLVLSMFSIIIAARPGGEAAVARVQKWGMVASVASVLAASALRMVVMLPAASLESAWVAAFVLAGVVVIYLSLAWKFGGGRQAEESLSSGGGHDHGAGGVADPV
ncbi:unnamed protein product [Urochloa humidicola]